MIEMMGQMIIVGKEYLRERMKEYQMDEGLDRGSLYEGEYNRSSDEMLDVPMTGSNNGRADIIADGMEMMIELLKVQSQVIRRYRCWR